MRTRRDPVERTCRRGGVGTRVGLAFIVCLALGALTLQGAYGWFKQRALSEARQRDLPLHTANSIKHAFAAAQAYSWLRLTGLPEGVAGRIVYRLGQANEWAEFYGRWPTARDPTREIYKDLHNNTVGLVAAAWLETREAASDSQRLALIGELTARDVIMRSFQDPRSPAFADGDDPERSDLHLALARFKRAHPALIRAINESL